MPHCRAACTASARGRAIQVGLNLGSRAIWNPVSYWGQMVGSAKVALDYLGINHLGLALNLLEPGCGSGQLEENALLLGPSFGAVAAVGFPAGWGDRLGTLPEASGGRI